MVATDEYSIVQATGLFSNKRLGMLNADLNSKSLRILLKSAGLAHIATPRIKDTVILWNIAHSTFMG